MKKRGLMYLVTLLLLFPMLTISARADIGPKPSVVVDFKGLEHETYSATLLSEQYALGPWQRESEYQDWYGPKEIWEAFCAYTDPDGFGFLGCFADCSETDRFTWGYYPPERFKILLYFPEQNRFIVSGEVFERYAFDSYYTVDVSGTELRTAEKLDAQAAVSRSYDLKWELASLLCRTVLTIALELAVAWLFRFRSRKQLRLIGLTNAATQVVLNILLNIINYKYGGLAFLFHYIWMEAVVFLIEGMIYSRKLRAETKSRTASPWLYALAANAVSCAAGIQIARWIPGIF